MHRRYGYTPASLPLLRWLTDPGPEVPARVRELLLGELFTSPKAVLMGVLNGLLVGTMALLLDGRLVFAAIIVIDVVLAVARIRLAGQAAAAAAGRARTPTDLALIVAIAWCALQGSMAFEAMLSSSHALQILASTSMFGLVGPICARNYAAPRYAFLLVCLCDLPYVLGALLSGDRGLLAVLGQTPLFMAGTMIVLRRFQHMAVITLMAQQDSSDKAHRDALTGLLNRPGLVAEILGGHGGRLPRQFTLFYLDLDGFKRVNDTRGHEAGDRLLQDVATRLRDSTRATDLVARMGGDEFVIVAPDLPPSEAPSLATTVIKRITDQPYEVGTGDPPRVGISIGYACYPEDGLELAELMGQADAALYAVKKSGKGRQQRCSPASLVAAH